MGEQADDDPAPGGEPRPGGSLPELLAAFEHGGAWDAAGPSAALAAALEAAAGPRGRYDGAEAGSLVGIARQWAAVESWAAAGTLAALRAMTREDGEGRPLTRRRCDLPDGWTDSLNYEIAGALAMGPVSAGNLAALAWTLGLRLPGIGRLLADGTLTKSKARLIAATFDPLDEREAARAEALILGELPGKTWYQVQRLAWRAAIAIAPDVAERRRAAAERHRARVTVFREESGAAGLSGRDLPPDAVLSAHANLLARAAQYHASGAFPSETGGALEALAYLHLLNGVTLQDAIAFARAATAEPPDTTTHDDDDDDDPFGGDPFGEPGGDERAPGHDDDDDDDGPDDDRPEDNRPEDNRPDDDDGGLDGGSGPDAGHDEGPFGESGGNDRPLDEDEDEDEDEGPDDDGDPHGGPGPGAGHGGDGGPGDDDGPGGGGGPDDDGPSDGDGDPDNGGSGSDGGDGGAGGRTVLPEVTAPLATLQGRAGRPGENRLLGPLDPALTRDLAAAAARSPYARWEVTIIDDRGYAIGHGTARPPRRRPQQPQSQPQQPPGPVWCSLPARVNITVTETHLRQLAARAAQPRPGAPPCDWDLAPRTVGAADGPWALTLPGGRELTVRFDVVPTHECDHRYQVNSYEPGERLRRLVQIRDHECTFPTCSRPAKESDFEHAVPYHKGGKTDACNAGARSRRCHQIKQMPGWQVTQPRPGWHSWTTPTGRTYVQEPWRYIG